MIFCTKIKLSKKSQNLNIIIATSKLFPVFRHLQLHRLRPRCLHLVQRLQSHTAGVTIIRKRKEKTKYALIQLKAILCFLFFCLKSSYATFTPPILHCCYLIETFVSNHVCTAVNFINVICAQFSYECHFGSFP